VDLLSAPLSKRHVPKTALVMLVVIQVEVIMHSFRKMVSLGNYP